MTNGTSPYDMEVRAEWTNERVERLRALWTEGLSASQIADDLGGVTRRGVIGKAHRLHLEPRGRGHRVSTEKSEPRPRPRIARRSKFRMPAPDVVVPVAVPAPAASPIEIDDTPLRCVETTGPSVDLTRLTNSTCRWPLHADGELPRFCGALGADLAAGRPYCARHARLSVVRPVSAAQVEARKKNGAMNAVRWRQGRGVTRYSGARS
ncbi:GcrA family cell cycle regulator [Rhodoplanes serenus]|uniref:GcrA family cell cycle regulator n=1 Tax=Rhodoplanes serenus TaxID=200615 RepID=UPI0011B94C6D|nr:GcrA family cell cycle regulator [Rhodoplanes serenus]